MSEQHRYPSEVDCDVCGEGRPEHLTATIRHDVSHQAGLPLGSLERVVRYCCDHGACIEAAEEPSNWQILFIELDEPIAAALPEASDVVYDYSSSQLTEET